MNANKVAHAMSLKDRVHFLDIVRGFALMGIILVNYFLIVDSAKGFDMEANDVFHNLVNWFASGKFITLFSFLFGVGFMIFMDRVASEGGQSEQAVCPQINHSLRIWPSACHLCLDW